MTYFFPRPRIEFNMVELLRKYHSHSAAKRRLTATRLEDAYGDFKSVSVDCALIGRLASEVLDYDRPRVSIVVPAYNEEVELIPTILTFLFGIAATAIPVEIIGVDNRSTDESRQLLDTMGIKVVDCDVPGLRYARAAGLAACGESSEYVWLVDADTRLLPPNKSTASSWLELNPLDVSYRQLEENPRCIATSTGVVFEYQRGLRRVLRQLRLITKGGLPYSCWSGANQFIRKAALLAIGGIDLEVDGGEDHHRIFELMRYARRHDLYLRGADREKNLLAPVYTSDRRNASLKQIIRNAHQQARKPRLNKDAYGLPVHQKGVRHKDLFNRERGKAAR